MPITATNGHIHQVPLSELQPGPWQPRRVFDEESLLELALSVKDKGILTPLRVVKSPAGTGYLIIAGERRWRAARLAGIGELPCLVMDSTAGDHTLRELAVLDNLHRENLRPGEEARAVAELERSGITLRDIARRLGKSYTWVSQRVTIARLPEPALHYLDNGTMTREEALALARLLDHLDLIEACLEPDGRRLATRLGGYVPDGIGERVQAILRVLEIERQRSEWASKMSSEGHQVLDEPPRESDRRFVRLLHGSELARAHQEARLSCEAWVWENGRPVRYCTNGPGLQQTMSAPLQADSVEQAREEEQRRVLEREAARDQIIKAWLATNRGLETRELAVLARERVRVLAFSDDRLLVRLGNWLGTSGDRSACLEAAKVELANASERRLLQLWFLLEVAQSVSYSVIPAWLAPWLERIGFTDPYSSSDAGPLVPDVKED